MESTSDLLTIKQASEWASQYLHRKVTNSNISYLIQYGRVQKTGDNGSTLINKEELRHYYNSFLGERETRWTKVLGEDLNWHLSFDYLRESERTKHVHRLHPYKGKFIPQLVEYFLDDHIDDFKKDIYFNKGDVVLDPFAGSGTTLVQANELGIHAIGIDITSFNSLITNVKTTKCDISELKADINRITSALNQFISFSNIREFQDKLDKALNEFNYHYFPSPAFKVRVLRHEINEQEYGWEKSKQFQNTFQFLTNRYGIQVKQEVDGFLGKWYVPQIRNEIEFVRDLIEKVSDETVRKVLTVILSRTIRSCRATTHYDLATLKEPIYSTYYCHKHGKICKPLFSMYGWWQRYCEDTIERLLEFERVRTDTKQICLTGDSRTINIYDELENKIPSLSQVVKENGIKGIFSSPPYVGLIDYHDQHAYAYELFGFEKRENLEIGALSKGQGVDARKQYVESISEVICNCKKFLSKDFDIFLVANDKFKLYPTIAEKGQLQIVHQFKRPVLCRTERDKAEYSETVFHMKAKI